MCKQGNLDEAEKHILKAIEQPSYILVSQSYENLALCQLKANQFKKAETYFAKAILHSPSSASSLLQMMQLQYAKKDYKNAELYLKRYEKSTRRFAPGALALAFKIFEKQHDDKIAKNYAAMLVKMFPNSYEAKQFMLNGLREIEADQIAQRYKVYKASQSTSKSKSKKRVVVLSPSNSADKNKQRHTFTNKPQRVEKISTTANHVNSQEIKQAEPDVKSNRQATLQQNQTKVATHHVAKGDNLFLISKQYNIQMKALKRWNKIGEKHVLKIGDVIYLAKPNEIKR